jgi:NADH-quinone oxidoreductase subunit L
MDPQSLTFLGVPALLWIALLPLLGAVFNLVLGRYFSKATVHTVAIAAVFGACVLSGILVFWALFQLGPTGTAYWKSGGFTQVAWHWLEIGSFKADLAFHLDTLSAVMILIITFVGTLIHIYSTGYMAHDPGYARYFGYLNLFTGAMLILVLANNLPVMFIGWEGVGLCSFLLIGFWYENDAFAYAGRKAFVVNRIGDFAFLLGMFLLYWGVHSLDFSDLNDVAHHGALYVGKVWGPDKSQVWIGEHYAAAAGILLFFGACGKSAQLPLFVWLPDAMAGPTPVSALIHAATMVTAGVYMVCRLSFLYTASTTAMIVVSTVGLLTALVAAFIAFAQTDLKKVLAYSTVSQLGFMFVAAGCGAFPAAIFHLGTHAFFKACLFLGAGSVMHGMEHGGSKTPGDITTMGGLRKHMPITRITFLISCLAISGIIPFAGFFSKDDILGGAWSTHPPGWPEWYGKFLWAGLLLAAFGTAFYMWRLYFMVFGGNERTSEAKHAHESPRSMTMPLVILAFFATVIGFISVPHFAHLKDKPETVASAKVPTQLHSLTTWLEPSVAHYWRVWNATKSEVEIKEIESGVETERSWPIDETHPADGGKDYPQLTPDEPELDQRSSSDPKQEAELEREIHKDVDRTWMLLGIALSVGLLGIGGAWMFYGRGPSPSVDRLVGDGGPLAGAYTASKHKLWFDEFYDATIVRPFKALARGLFEIVDRFVIDTVAVNGVAFVVGLFGRLARWFQNGQVQRYLAGLVVGAAAVFFVTDCHRHPSFEITRVGTSYELQLHADVGVGVPGTAAKLHWHIDGSTDCDADKGKPSDAPDLTIQDGDVMSGSVALCIEDPIEKKMIAVTRSVPPRREVTP